HRDYEGKVSTLCAGCGHDSITASIIEACYESSIEPHRVAKISGIGCSSKTPDYFLGNSHGFNSVPGRMPSVSTGANLANRDSIYLGVSGDGDSASIGFGQFAHSIRRGVNMTYIVENNGVYGLTKGQYSPTSREGTHSPTTPLGSVDRPASPCAFASGAGARFIARAYDVSKDSSSVLKAAPGHQGAAFVEIFQNCIVYNKDRFDDFTAKGVADQNQLWVKDGEPMSFGSEKSGGVRGIALDMDTSSLKVVDVLDGDWQAAGVIVHNVKNRAIAHMLVEMPFGPFPMASGVIFDDTRPTYEATVSAQDAQARAGQSANLAKSLAKGQTWTRRTRKGSAATVSAANSPDIDVFFGWAPWPPSAMHRGFTHGSIGGVSVSPPVLAISSWSRDRWPARSGRSAHDSPPMRFGWSSASCWIGADRDHRAH
ncbi:hypothetical protein OY671_007675, partial [Metschnikowia pulcherrima]